MLHPRFAPSLLFAASTLVAPAAGLAAGAPRDCAESPQRIDTQFSLNCEARKALIQGALAQAQEHWATFAQAVPKKLDIGASPKDCNTLDKVAAVSKDPNACFGIQYLLFPSDPAHPRPRDKRNLNEPVFLESSNISIPKIDFGQIGVSCQGSQMSIHVPIRALELSADSDAKSALGPDPRKNCAIAKFKGAKVSIGGKGASLDFKVAFGGPDGPIAPVPGSVGFNAADGAVKLDLPATKAGEKGTCDWVSAKTLEDFTRAIADTYAGNPEKVEMFEDVLKNSLVDPLTRQLAQAIGSLPGLGHQDLTFGLPIPYVPGLTPEAAKGQSVTLDTMLAIRQAAGSGDLVTGTLSACVHCSTVVQGDPASDPTAEKGMSPETGEEKKADAGRPVFKSFNSYGSLNRALAEGWQAQGLGLDKNGFDLCSVHDQKNFQPCRPDSIKRSDDYRVHLAAPPTVGFDMAKGFYVNAANVRLTNGNDWLHLQHFDASSDARIYGSLKFENGRAEFTFHDPEVKDVHVQTALGKLGNALLGDFLNSKLGVKFVQHVADTPFVRNRIGSGVELPDFGLRDMMITPGINGVSTRAEIRDAKQLLSLVPIDQIFSQEADSALGKVTLP